MTTTTIPSSSSSSPSPSKSDHLTGALLSSALIDHEVSANVVDIDHYRIQGGMAVETDYIIEVKYVGSKHIDEGGFHSFKISKTYSAFRRLASKAKKCANLATTIESNIQNNKSSRKRGAGSPSFSKKKISSYYTEDDSGGGGGGWMDLPQSSRDVISFAESLVHLVESQPTEYFGKVNFNYVKGMSKQRRAVINDALELILTKFPKHDAHSPAISSLASYVQNFLLTDHVVENVDDDDHSLSLLHNNNNNKSRNDDDDVYSAIPQSNTPTTTTTTHHHAASRDISEGYTEVIPVVPLSRKPRLSFLARTSAVASLKHAGDELLLDDGTFTLDNNADAADQSHTKKKAWARVSFFFDNPLIFFLFFIASLPLFRLASVFTITLDGDLALFILAAGFCIGLHFPHNKSNKHNTSSLWQHTPPPPSHNLSPQHTKRSTTTTTTTMESFHRGSALLRASMQSSRAVVFSKPSSSSPTTTTTSLHHHHHPSEDGMERDYHIVENVLTNNNNTPPPLDQIPNNNNIITPIPKFPDHAELGSVPNCWSEPPSNGFKVRGIHYFKDKKKYPSGPFLFPIRAVDLFLTDSCPENVGSISAICGGKIRDIPTFIINFRLPWGVLLFHFEIPNKFIPFLQSRYEKTSSSSSLSKQNLLDIMNKQMTPSERCVARFLLGDDHHKNAVLKIIPILAKGPWIIKSVVDGKPAIIGKKLPVSYIYGPPDETRGLACYLEADLDIVADATARRILALVRSYTTSITMDLGFVVQGGGGGNSDDNDNELPEQMLCAARIHQMDPFNASPLPPMKDAFLSF